MAEEKKEKIVYISTYGPEDPEAGEPSLRTGQCGAGHGSGGGCGIAGGECFPGEKKGCWNMYTRRAFRRLRSWWIHFWSKAVGSWCVSPAFRRERIDVSDLIDDAVPTAGGSLTEEFLKRQCDLGLLDRMRRTWIKTKNEARGEPSFSGFLD